MHSRFLRPASSTNTGEMVSDTTSERARQLSVEKRCVNVTDISGSVSLCTSSPLPEKGCVKAAFAPFHAQLGPLQVTMARFYGVPGSGYGLF